MNSKQYAYMNRSVNLSVTEIADVLEKRYEIETLSGGIDYFSLYRAICGVMSKVFVIHPDCLMKLRDETVPARHVQAVYRTLTCANIEWAAQQFKSQTNKVQNFTQWMRTVLYFSPEDMEGNYINELET